MEEQWGGRSEAISEEIRTLSIHQPPCKKEEQMLGFGTPAERCQYNTEGLWHKHLQGRKMGSCCCCINREWYSVLHDTLNEGPIHFNEHRVAQNELSSAENTEVSTGFRDHFIETWSVQNRLWRCSALQLQRLYLFQDLATGKQTGEFEIRSFGGTKWGHGIFLHWMTWSVSWEACCYRDLWPTTNAATT